jgi:hypothetical protein
VALGILKLNNEAQDPTKYGLDVGAKQDISAAANSTVRQAREDNYMEPIDCQTRLNAAVRQTLARTIMLSSRRYLGLAPEAAEPGDQIFVLFGLRQAAILRPQDGGTYKFIETAYVHGIMWGKWQKDLELGLYQTQSVSIR